MNRALKLGKIFYEKCELAESRLAFVDAYRLAKKSKNSKRTLDAIIGLLRLANEALDPKEVARWSHELDRWLEKYPRARVPMVWYCKGIIVRQQENYPLALRFFHKYLKATRLEARKDSQELHRAWAVIAATYSECNRMRRAEVIARLVLKKIEGEKSSGIHGLIYMVLGKVSEHANDLVQAQSWYDKASAAFLIAHHWYYHLHVLRSVARVARKQQRYAQAYWYLDLLDKATQGAEFGAFRSVLETERALLEKDAVDLLIDRRRSLIRTGDLRQVSLGKQHILLNILEALSEGRPRGLSKAELIEKVWHERYRPEAHDNKLYYNINRLRKLIESDVRKPKYLLNWREGYRLAPGLRIQFIEGEE